MKVDLHIHTTASDGAWSAEKVVRAAAHGGLDVIAIADHDTTRSVSAAVSAGLDVNVHVIPAIEASSTWEGREIHVLGYFLDADSPELEGHEGRARRLRDGRMRAMIGRLLEQGIEVTFPEVEEAAGVRRSSLARPHLARVLLAKGYATSVPDAFNRLIGDHCEAFVPTDLQSPVEAIRMIRAAGGIPVWAHPPKDLVDALLPSMVEAGLRGLEVYRPGHRRSDVRRLEGICRTAGLLKSGGSDWHTPEYGPVLGDFSVSGDDVGALLSEGGL